jgi:hypothetical protein
VGALDVFPPPVNFAALKADGSIKVWGSPDSGGANAPTDKGYIKIYSTDSAFAALKADGSITVWGNSNRGGADARFNGGKGLPS